MKQELKEDINILLLKDTGKLLMKEEIKYLVIEGENGIDVKELPIVHKDYLSVLYDYLAYDYDELNSMFQEKYRFHYKKLKKCSENKYLYNTKTYIKKNNR